VAVELRSRATGCSENLLTDVYDFVDYLKFRSYVQSIGEQFAAPEFEPGCPVQRFYWALNVAALVTRGCVDAET